MKEYFFFHYFTFLFIPTFDCNIILSIKKIKGGEARIFFFFLGRRSSIYKGWKPLQQSVPTILVMMKRLKLFSLHQRALKKETGRKNTKWFLHWPFWAPKKEPRSSETSPSVSKKKTFQQILFYWKQSFNLFLDCHPFNLQQFNFV